jgi:release factor glutamine methyltransferase
MSVNSQPKTPVISQWIIEAATVLEQAGISSARLDAEILLSHTLRKPRTYLHAHPEEPLDVRALEIADARLALRKDRAPLAYITGHKEFYGRNFKVTPSTLIPRPESEPIITLLKQLAPRLPANNRLIDVGTGSGCLGITAKLEAPEFDVTLIDSSKYALVIARFNAEKHHAEVSLIHGDLLTSYPFKAAVVIANLPYVDPSWERSPETDHEPAKALFAGSNGLALIYKLFRQLPEHLEKGGILLLEADPRQYNIILQTAEKQSLELIANEGFITALRLR